MVTVASEATVPSALRVTLMSPLPIASSATDMGAPFRLNPPRPSCCGAVPCLVHQTIPATTSSTRMTVSTNRQPDPGFGGGAPVIGALVGGLSGLSMNVRHTGLRGSELFVPRAYPFRYSGDIATTRF